MRIQVWTCGPAETNALPISGRPSDAGLAIARDVARRPVSVTGMLDVSLVPTRQALLNHALPVNTARIHDSPGALHLSPE